MYAAYRTGKDWGEAFPEGLSPADFIARLHQIAESAFNEVEVFVARTNKGEVPVGLVAALLDQHLAWPHIQWFPWASGRNRVECSLRYLKRAGKKGRVVLAAAEDKDKGFFEHLARYGAMRRVGTIHGYFAGGKSAALFQSRVEENSE